MTARLPPTPSPRVTATGVDSAGPIGRAQTGIGFHDPLMHPHKDCPDRDPRSATAWSRVPMRLAPLPAGRKKQRAMMTGPRVLL